VELFRGTRLPDDAISVLVGFDGNEFDEVLRRQQWLLSHELSGMDCCRVAVAINTCYPCVAGAVYLNRNLIGLVQSVLEDLGLFVTVFDIMAHGEQKILPVEPRSSLEDDEEYALVGPAADIKGVLITWNSHMQYMGPFYTEDSFVLDLLLPTPLVDPFRQALQERCRQENIKYVDAGQGPIREPRPEKVGLIRRAWRFLK
jgi:hypothetical protein